jgi:hypothetical protein
VPYASWFCFLSVVILIVKITPEVSCVKLHFTHKAVNNYKQFKIDLHKAPSLTGGAEFFPFEERGRGARVTFPCEPALSLNSWSALRKHDFDALFSSPISSVRYGSSQNTFSAGMVTQSWQVIALNVKRKSWKFDTH